MRWLSLSLLACGPKTVAHSTENAAPSMVFEPITVAEPAHPLTAPRVLARAVVDGAPVDLTYQVLRRAGEQGFGQLVDRAGAPIPDGVCNEQDFNAILTVDGQPFLVSHFECAPGSMQISALDARGGALSIRSSTTVDFASVGGLWNPCAGQISPWNTHLGSEEYDPDARAEPTPEQYWPHLSWQGMKRYQPEPIEPYRYGWIPEVAIADRQGTYTVKKHLSPGRASHEIAYVLPDQRTVYLSDDGSYVGWFLFVADRPGDLSSGRLYAAKLTDGGGGALDVAWIDLGASDDAALARVRDAGLRFSDLFEVADRVDGGCPTGFRYVHHAYGEECLQLAAPSARVPDPALAASRFEKRRYAAYVGATTELEKAEGVTYDPIGRRVFLAVTRVGKGMTDGKGDLDLPKNPCGVVYAGAVATGVRDTAGNPIDGWVHTRLEPVVVGAMDAMGERCTDDSIANPDNITYLPGYGQLVIAEDTALRDRARLWAFDDRGVGAALMEAPPYGEFTGVYWHPDVAGHGYLTVTVQHPWSEGDVTLPPEVTAADLRTFTGVLGPFPRLRGALPQAE